jgi:hypothetical protein
MKFSNYGRFRNAKGGMWSAPEDCGVPCGYGSNISIKAYPN